MLIRLTPPTCECDIVDYCIIISTAVVFHRRTGSPAHCVYDARIVMSFRMSGYYDRFVFALRTFLCCRSSLWSLAASTPGDMVCVSVTQRKSMEITLLRKSVHKVIASILLSAVLDKNQKMQRKTLLTIFGSLVNLRTEPGVLLCCVPLHGHWGYMVLLFFGSNSHCCLMWIFSISSI